MTCCLHSICNWSYSDWFVARCSTSSVGVAQVRSPGRCNYLWNAMHFVDIQQNDPWRFIDEKWSTLKTDVDWRLGRRYDDAPTSMQRRFEKEQLRLVQFVCVRGVAWRLLSCMDSLLPSLRANCDFELGKQQQAFTSQAHRRTHEHTKWRRCCSLLLKTG